LTRSCTLARSYAESAEAILEGLLNYEKVGVPRGAGMAGKAGFDLVQFITLSDIFLPFMKVPDLQ
jgi:hypothetical protein